MTQTFTIHPTHPQARLVAQIVDRLREGAIMIYPTDSAYALGCHLGDKQALERIKNLRKLDKNHNFTLVCRNLSELSNYAQVNNSVFRLLKAYTPGPYTFILPAGPEVPKRLQHEKRKTIGLRIPDNPVAQAILEALNEPLMSVSFILPNEELPVADLDQLDNKIKAQVDLVVDGGACGFEPTSVIDLVEGVPKVLRAGKGDISPFQ